jgi:hypothetical protein
MPHAARQNLLEGEDLLDALVLLGEGDAGRLRLQHVFCADALGAAVLVQTQGADQCLRETQRLGPPAGRQGGAAQAMAGRVAAGARLSLRRARPSAPRPVDAARLAGHAPLP